MAGRFVDAAETEWESLKYGGPRLRSSGGSTSLRSGVDGSDRTKREGDGATPTGTYLLVLGSTGKFGSSHEPRSRRCGICGHDAWVDDPVDARYDSLFTLPCSAQAERMWRNDRIYDVLIVIGYNMNPVIQVRAAPYFYTQPARILLLPRAVSRSAGTSCPI